VTYNARLSCSRAHRVRDELIAARTHAGLPALNFRRIYNHGATASARATSIAVSLFRWLGRRP
jgi:hypothetical protein